MSAYRGQRVSKSGISQTVADDPEQIFQHSKYMTSIAPFNPDRYPRKHDLEKQNGVTHG
jgi:hypothetical protein